jgi:hypothetical protein
VLIGVVKSESAMVVEAVEVLFVTTSKEDAADNIGLRIIGCVLEDENITRYELVWQADE